MEQDICSVCGCCMKPNEVNVSKRICHNCRFLENKFRKMSFLKRQLYEESPLKTIRIYIKNGYSHNKIRDLIDKKIIGLDLKEINMNFLKRWSKPFISPISDAIRENEIELVEESEEALNLIQVEEEYFNMDFEEFLSTRRRSKRKISSRVEQPKSKYKFKDYVVYARYVPATNRVKIGMTDNIESRFDTAFTDASSDFKLLGVKRFDKDKVECEAFELWCHKVLSNHRCTIITPFKISENEFFEYNTVVKEFINKHFEEYPLEVM